MKFPRLVYKSASKHILVANEAEMDAALQDGWFASVPEAMGVKVPVKAALPKVEDLGTAPAETPAIALSVPTTATTQPVAPAKVKKVKAAPPTPITGKNPWD